MSLLRADHLKLGSHLSKVRKAKGLSQQAVADAAGVTRRNYARIESGEAEPKTGTALRIASVLNFPVPSIWFLY